jgi:hypothetical protein
VVIAGGLAFGGLAFLAGAVLGPVRELVLAPWLGGVPAAWVEAAVMAVALWFAARATVRAELQGRARVRLALVALAVVLLAEALLSVALAHSGLAAARAPRGWVEQLPGFVLLLWLVALPFLVRR